MPTGNLFDNPTNVAEPPAEELLDVEPASGEEAEIFRQIDEINARTVDYVMSPADRALFERLQRRLGELNGAY